MSDSYEDYVNDSLITIEETYCKNHKGLWYHECGCEPPEDEEE